MTETKKPDICCKQADDINCPCRWLISDRCQTLMISLIETRMTIFSVFISSATSLMKTRNLTRN
jgi:hypothetical protein